MRAAREVPSDALQGCACDPGLLPKGEAGLAKAHVGTVIFGLTIFSYGPESLL